MLFRSYRNFGKENQEAIASLTVPEAEEMIKEGQFGEGTMLPKIEAAISYLSANKDGRVLITSLAKVSDALKEKAGTILTA